MDEESIKRTQRTGLTTILYVSLTKYRMAKDLGVSQQVVQGWFLRGRISARAAVTAEEVYGIKKEDLRPDVITWSE
jgi:DNA-binding transcriptional regulator YdaS (Cro superfamily)